MRKFVAPIVLERVISTHFINSLVICVRRLSVLGFCYVCGRLFLDRVIFTHLFACLFVFKLIISVHGCYTPATGRLEPSRIVAVRANLATRDPSRIVTIRQLFQG